MIVHTKDPTLTMFTLDFDTEDAHHTIDAGLTYRGARTVAKWLVAKYRATAIMLSKPSGRIERLKVVDGELQCVEVV